MLAAPDPVSTPSTVEVLRARAGRNSFRAEHLPLVRSRHEAASQQAGRTRRESRDVRRASFLLGEGFGAS